MFSTVCHISSLSLSFLLSLPYSPQYLFWITTKKHWFFLVINCNNANKSNTTSKSQCLENRKYKFTIRMVYTYIFELQLCPVMAQWHKNNLTKYVGRTFSRFLFLDSVSLWFLNSLKFILLTQAETLMYHISFEITLICILPQLNMIFFSFFGHVPSPKHLSILHIFLVCTCSFCNTILIVF